MNALTHEALTAALEAVGAQIIAERERTARAESRWRESASAFSQLRQRVHADEKISVWEVDLDDLQAEIFSWQTKNFGDQPAHRSFLGVVEEVGELAHAILKHEQAIRGTPEEHVAAKKDAIGDAMIFLLNYCSAHGYSLARIVRETWGEVSQRDWIAFPKNGLTE
jgi:NTP pyrophosphatase (non-canonical NTP hydrolase)